MNKYHIWDMIDNLEEVYHRKTPDFDFVYKNFLDQLFNIYTEFLRYPDIHVNKLFRFLTDKKDRIKYSLPDFPDKKFAELFLKSILENKRKAKLELFIDLARHIQNKMGGFNIDGWKMRSSAKI